MVVCTLREKKEIMPCIISAKKQTRKFDEIIIIADKKMNITGAKVYVQKGKGLPNARNQSLEIVKGDIIVFWDDDVVVEKNWLSEVLKIYKKHPEAGGVGGKIKRLYIQDIKKGFFGKLMRAYGKVFGISGFFGSIHEGIGKILPNGFAAINWEKLDKLTEVEWLPGCGMSFRKKVMDEVGFFDESLIGNSYYEDVDYSYRVFLAGYKLYATPKAVMDHLVSPTAREKVPKLKYFQLYNQKIFFEKNVHQGSLIRKAYNNITHFSIFLPMLLYSLIMKEPDMIKAYIKAEFKKPFQ